MSDVTSRYISKARTVYDVIEMMDARFRDEEILDAVIETINAVPVADMDAILDENYTMRKQLAQIGKKPGDKMDDVRPVVRGTWTEKIDNDEDPIFRRKYECSACGKWNTYGKSDFCPNCGADMRQKGEETE